MIDTDEGEKVELGSSCTGDLNFRIHQVLAPDPKTLRTIFVRGFSRTLRQAPPQGLTSLLSTQHPRNENHTEGVDALQTPANLKNATGHKCCRQDLPKQFLFFLIFSQTKELENAQPSQTPEGIKTIPFVQKIWKIPNHKRDRAKRRNIRQMLGCNWPHGQTQTRNLATPKSRPRARLFLHFSKGDAFKFASTLTRSRCGHPYWNVLVQHSRRFRAIIADTNALGVEAETHLAACVQRNPVRSNESMLPLCTVQTW